MRLEKYKLGLARAGRRWGLSLQAIVILLVLVYFTAIGGTRAGTYHFPLIVVSQLLVLAALGYFVARRLTQRQWLARTPLDLPLLAFYLLNLVSTAFSSNLRISVENLAYLTLFILLYYALVDSLLSGWEPSDFVKPMLLVASIVVLVEILELVVWLGIWAVGTGELSPLLTLGEYRRRLVMGPANVLAWYVVLMLPLVLAEWLTSHSLRTRANLGALTVGLLLVLASTLSRSGLVGVAVALAVFTLLTLGRMLLRGRRSFAEYLRRPRVAAALLLVVMLSVVFAVIVVRLMPARLYSISVRFELWRAAADIVASRPLFGGGPGTFGFLFHQVPDPNPYATDMYYNNAHNGFINVAAESGVPSLVAGLWLLAALTRTAWRYLTDSTRDEGPSRAVIAGCVAGVLGLMASMLFDVPWVFPLTTLYVVLLAAIVVAPFSSRRTVPAPALRWITALVLFLIAAVLGWGDIAHWFQYRAVGARHLGRLDASVADMQTARSLDPLLTMYAFQHGVVTAYRGLANDDESALVRAVQEYEREISRDGDTAINNGNLAWLEWKLGHIDRALAYMEQASVQAPRDAYYKLGWGFLLEASGNCGDAAGAYSSAIALTPSLIDSAFWQTSDCRKAFMAELQTDGTPPGLARAWVAYLTHDYEAAARIITDLAPSGSALVLRGRVEAAQGQYSSARQTLDRALAMAPTSTTAYLARGQLFLEQGDEASALHDLRVAGLLGEKDADVLLGEIAYQAGDLEKAIALIRPSAPDCVALTSSYDYASQVYHRSDLSADFWPTTITCAPYDDLVPHYLHLALAYRSVGRPEDAEGVCHWLSGFYEDSYLDNVDVNGDWQDACPKSAARGVGSTAPASRQPTAACPLRGGPA
jgi:tetratricopeptide (TPR) repeat protein/O-antigen ligase